MKNIDRTYIIKTVNKQTIDFQSDIISESARGTYQKRGNKSYILYKTVEDGEENSSIIIIEGDTVTIKRRGMIESNMIFSEGCENTSLYVMPYGKMTIRIKTKKVSVKLNENGGEVHLEYILIIQGEEYYNDMTIKVIGE